MVIELAGYLLKMRKRGRRLQRDMEKESHQELVMKHKKKSSFQVLTLRGLKRRKRI